MNQGDVEYQRTLADVMTLTRFSPGVVNQYFKIEYQHLPIRCPILHQTSDLVKMSMVQVSSQAVMRGCIV